MSKAKGALADIWYISGPMRGKPGHNHELFVEVEIAFRSRFPNYGAINPALNFGGNKTLEVERYLTLDIRQVLESSGLVMLPGWEKSEGANLEVTVALATGKRFMVASKGEEDWLFEPYAPWEIDLLRQPKSSERGSVLDEAKGLITGDRNAIYGPPTQDFLRTAAMANAFGFQVNGKPLESHHVAVFMGLLKLSRLAWSPGKRDSWVDLAGYAACGYECSVADRTFEVKTDD